MEDKLYIVIKMYVNTFTNVKQIASAHVTVASGFAVTCSMNE